MTGIFSLFKLPFTSTSIFPTWPPLNILWSAFGKLLIPSSICSVIFTWLRMYHTWKTYQKGPLESSTCTAYSNVKSFHFCTSLSKFEIVWRTLNLSFIQITRILRNGSTYDYTSFGINRNVFFFQSNFIFFNAWTKLSLDDTFQV